MIKRRRSFEGSSRCSAPVSTVWAVWTDPLQWPGDVFDAAKIDGDFVVGAKVTAKLKGLTTTLTLIKVDPPRMWTGVSKFPGVILTVEHLIEAADGGALLTERAVMSGPLAGVTSRVIGARLEKDFAGTTAGIARLAEAHCPDGSP
ncbi:MAG: SRPBCC family protein [Mycobacteriaceae bacterium]|nr:SRPBCC family protein [Mycobacteriaceae bacterium]